MDEHTDDERRRLMSGIYGIQELRRRHGAPLLLGIVFLAIKAADPSRKLASRFFEPYMEPDDDE